jgi:hypothetical protein
MKEYIEKQELQIDNKIFTKSDLAKLFRLFIRQSNEILDKSKEIKRQMLIRDGWSEKNITEGYINTSHSAITLTTSVNSYHTYSFEDLDIAIQTLDEQVITEVELQFAEKTSDCRLSVKLRHSGTNRLPGNITAEGMDSDWVNTSIKIFEDFLAECGNQSGFVRKYKYPIIITIIGLFSLFLVNFIKFFIKAEVSFPKIVSNIFKDDLIYYIVIFTVVSTTPAIMIYRWLKKLYPDVDIQTGPDSGKLQKERRNKIFLLIIAVIIPVVISFLIK